MAVSRWVLSHEPVLLTQPLIHWGAEMFGVGDFWLETRVITKISTHPFMGMKQNRILFQNGQLKNTEIFIIANSQHFFTKRSGIGPWVSMID